MTYREAMEINESRSGLDYEDLTIESLMALIDDIPGWDYPLAEECMSELASRAGIDKDSFFADGDHDYSDLWAACAKALDIDF